VSRLAGVAAIVTGAASGMGRATALLAAREGASVVCLDIADPASVVAEIEAAGGTAAPARGSVTDSAVWDETVKLARERFGGVHVLANVAGVVPAAGEDTAVDQTEAGWDTILAVDLKGPWLGMRAALPTMVEQGAGRIVNVVSVAALQGMQMLAAYSAAKAGLAGLTRQVAVDYARHGIRVNAVAPGDILTPMSQDNTPEVKQALLRRTPARRQGGAEEVAEVIVWLASPAADFVTGQVIAVDGGWSING
jgi:NAD(P)-dependent dehydrogenase (short-subunit alcohol dehydrogenase family)